MRIKILPAFLKSANPLYLHRCTLKFASINEASTRVITKSNLNKRGPNEPLIQQQVNEVGSKSLSHHSCSKDLSGETQSNREELNTHTHTQKLSILPLSIKEKIHASCFKNDEPIIFDIEDNDDVTLKSPAQKSVYGLYVLTMERGFLGSRGRGRGVNKKQGTCATSSSKENKCVKVNMRNDMTYDVPTIVQFSSTASPSIPTATMTDPDDVQSGIPDVKNTRPNTTSASVVEKGLTEVTMVKGSFFFRFSSLEGVDSVLRDDPWMIVWVKLYDVPLVAYTSSGLSLIATKNDKGKGQTSGGADDEGFIEEKKMKSSGNNGGAKKFKVVSVKPKTQYRPKAKQSTTWTSNSPKTTPFVALNFDNSIYEEVAACSKALLQGKLVLLDDAGKPLEKDDYPVNSDSTNEVEPVENKLQIFWLQRELDMARKACKNNGGKQ
ncbi:hypothetical protein Tco_0910674 [Tanacetum coccineum]|uniref:DUF4283 domain-containing protein n=1 Tax=Tanacetum coccineum TaxID=301880 RepID=A0ABQ5D0P5_9ASTR